MALDSVIDEIMNNAREEAKAIKAEGKSEATEILKKAKAIALENESKATKEAEELVASMEGREMSNANRQCKRIELDAKKELVDEVFEKVKSKVLSLDEKTKKNIYEKMIKQAKAETDAKTVYANPKDEAVVKAVASGLKFEADKSISGGLVIENSDGSVRADYTFDTVFSDMREESLEDVSKILFK